MAIIKTTNQYKVASNKPIDTKALVKTYAELISKTTWQTTNDKGNTVDIAYNGMLTAVWLNNVDPTKNGIYFLHDPAVTGIFGVPDVTNEANWHKLGTIDALPGLTEQITALQSELETIKSDVDELQDSATEVVDLFEKLPEIGKSGKLYVVTEDATTYVWHNGKYLLVGDGADDADIQIIHGGKASAN
jgi:hypothetical protein